MSSTHVRIFNLKSEQKLETLSGAQAAQYGNTFTYAFLVSNEFSAVDLVNVGFARPKECKILSL